MEKIEIPEMTDMEEVVFAVIAALYTMLVVWPLGLIAYLAGCNPWSSPRISRTVQQTITRAVTALTGILLGASILSTIGLMVVASNPGIGVWLLNQEWFRDLSLWWQGGPGQFFEWSLDHLPK